MSTWHEDRSMVSFLGYGLTLTKSAFDGIIENYLVSIAWMMSIQDLTISKISFKI